MVSTALGAFIAELRRRGLRVSTAERIDASNAALAVDLASKESFRAALRATLAKSAQESILFDEAFDAFFAPPRRSRRRGKGQSAEGAGGGSGRGTSGPGRRRPEHPDRPERSTAGGRRPPTGAGARRGSSATRVSQGRVPRILEPSGRRLSPSEARAGSDALLGRKEHPDPRRRDLRSAFTTEEERRLAREVPLLVEQIRLRRGRRYAEGLRGRLWVKKTIRSALAHGGIPFELPMRQRRPRRPRILLLVDVSRSVARAAGLFLLLCAGFRDRLSRVEVYFFVDRMVAATEAVSLWASGSSIARRGRAPRQAPAAAAGRFAAAPGAGVAPPHGAAFPDLVGSIADLDPGAASDYGRAFFRAREILGNAGGRDTVLVVLGDARTNRTDPLAWAFEEIASRCKRVIWLNPEPRHLWDTGDSVMSAYLPSCDVACEARDLHGLARGLRELLRAI